ncbi:MULTISPECIES: glycosyltransferase [unclassified Mesorhizobium]|uniref:glycosyltransferase n=1 Tax=unclassified Mesorhizobium TaxID=325217 RepID=UPI00112DC2CF|nr:MULTISPECIES: glycosyltransferase [unclassified Mesorhizobium]MBZ9702489.1 glycosyltransferase [Mesorhizobium sp. CO1-1-3]MBZ9948795.1 glycosyltransferase [Mesorhizobium sp. BR1-1-11]TPJ09587.1 glycosyltransferase family 4 protein [Mesorhizobium sp. B2-8-1]
MDGTADKLEPVLWMDLTATLHATGGIIGIIRAEMELAVGLYRNRANVRFFCLRGEALVEVPASELDWLLASENVADAFVARLKKSNRSGKPSPENRVGVVPPHIRKDIERVSHVDISRFKRFRAGRALLINAMEPGWRSVVRVATAPLVGIGVILSKAGIASRAAHAGLIGRQKPMAEPVVVPPVGFSHPFKDGDILFSAGFMLNDKERVVERVKQSGTRVYLGYLIYDIILISSVTRHLYPEYGVTTFQSYFDWMSRNCDFLIYGGQTAQKDSHQIQRERNLPIPPSAAIQFGNNLGVAREGGEDDATVLGRLGLTGKFMLTVGSIEGRKNHETLYRAYVMLLEKMGDAAPQLVFVGRPDPYSSSDLIDTLNRDPRIHDRLIVIQPSDVELDVLYRNCEFTMLPTLYEGWSLTLPESLGYGKLCLCSDVVPLREVGRDLVDYIAPWDVVGWRDRMEYYVINQKSLSSRNARIAENWKGTTWNDCALALNKAISALHHDNHGLTLSVAPAASTRPIWMDLTLSYLLPQKGISGVIRAELLFARELYKIDPSVRFFACDRGQAFEIPMEDIQWLFHGENLSADFIQFNQMMNERAAHGVYRSPYMSADTGLRTVAASKLSLLRQKPKLRNIWDAREGSLLVASALPGKWQSWLYKRAVHYNQKKTLSDAPSKIPTSQISNMSLLPDGAIVFFAGIDWTLTTLKALRDMPDRGRLFLAHVLYDMTPTITPHLHVIQSPPVYLKFLELVSNTFNFIIYGGKTAQRDATLIQKQNGFESPDSIPIHFGGDIVKMDSTEEQDRELLQSLGVTRKFLLAVGTIENRKNHDTLYKAYLTLLERGGDVPQLIFVGGQGWHTGDFMNRITRDDRVKGKIIISRANDAQLDALYRRCEFTLLASLYEGWSLTLPESLEYGKFCLVSDVEPLREVGGDLVDYVLPWDVMGWADKIRYYLDNPAQLKKRERAIKRNWKTYSWADCARDVYAALQSNADAHFARLADMGSPERTSQPVISPASLARRSDP